MVALNNDKLLLPKFINTEGILLALVSILKSVELDWVSEFKA